MGGLACKTKIILDSGGAAGYAQAIKDTAMSLSDAGEKKLTDEAAYPIIKLLIKAEKSLERAHNLFLDAMGYEGPRPEADSTYEHS